MDFVTNDRLNIKIKNEIINRLAPLDLMIFNQEFVKKEVIFSRLEITGRKIDYMQPLNANNL